MLLVIEGPDCVGKTTVCRALQKKLNWPLYNHVKLENKEDWSKMVDFGGKVEYELLRQIDWTKNNLIIDRFYASSIIYPTIFNRNVDTSYLNFLPGSVEVVIDLNWNELLYRYDTRKDKFINIEKLEEIWKAYHTYSQLHIPKYIKRLELNGNESVNQITEEILKMIKK